MIHARWLSHIGTPIISIRMRGVHFTSVNGRILGQESGSRSASGVCGLGCLAWIFLDLIIISGIKTGLRVVLDCCCLSTLPPSSTPGSQGIIRIWPILRGWPSSVWRGQTLQGPWPCVHTLLFLWNFISFCGLILHFNFNFLFLWLTAWLLTWWLDLYRLRFLLNQLRLLILAWLFTWLFTLIFWVTFTVRVRSTFILTIFDNYITWNDTKNYFRIFLGNIYWKIKQRLWTPWQVLYCTSLASIQNLL